MLVTLFLATFYFISTEITDRTYTILSTYIRTKLNFQLFTNYLTSPFQKIQSIHTKQTSETMPFAENDTVTIDMAVGQVITGGRTLLALSHFDLVVSYK